MAEIILKDVRICFMQSLWEAQQYNGQGAFRHTASFILDGKNQQDQIGAVEAEILREAKKQWPSNAEATVAALRAQDRLCLHDGAIKSDYAGFAGNMFVSASAKTRPLVVDRNPTVHVLPSDGKIYPGCRVNAKLAIWAQGEKAGFGKRVNAELKVVQFVRDDEPLGSSAPASIDGLEDLSSDDSGMI